MIGNFNVNLERFKKANFTYCPNDELTPKYLEGYAAAYFKDKPLKEDSILLVIDECQLLFNSRDWQQKGRADWLSFFTQHRKLGYKVLLIAQSDRMIDKQIRSLIEYEYTHRKMSNYGWQGWLMSLLFGGSTFIAVKRWYPLKEKIGSEVFHARKRLFRIYNTYGTFGDTAECVGIQGPCAEAVPPESDVLSHADQLLPSAENVDKVTDQDVNLNYTLQLLDEKESG